MPQSSLYRRASDEVVVNTVTEGQQRLPQIAKLAGGGYVISWLDVGTQAVPGRGAMAQMFDAADNRIGGEIVLGNANLSELFGVRVTALSNGGFAAVWLTNNIVSNSYQSAFRAFDALGVPTSNQIGFSFSGNSQAADDILTLSGDRVLVASTSGRGIILDASGSIVNANVAPSTNTFTSNGGIVTSPDGGFLFIFRDSGIKGRFFNADGTAIAPAFDIGSTFNTINFDAFTVAARTGGGYVIAYSDTSGSIHMFILGASGNVITSMPWIGRSGSSFSDPRFFATDDGGFMMTFADSLLNGPSNIVGQLYNANGTRSGSEFIISRSTDMGYSNHAEGEVMRFDDGRFVSVWQGAGPGDTRTTGTTTPAVDGGIRTQTFAPVDGPVAIDIATPLASLSEIAVQNIPLAILNSSSDAVNGLYSYAIISDSTGGAFSIAGNRLMLTNNNLVDREAVSSVSITVRSTDQAGNHVDETFQINVGDAIVERRYYAATELRINNTTNWSQDQPSVAALGNGYLVTWTDGSFTGDGTGSAVKAARFDATGAIIQSEFLVNTEGSAGQDSSSAVELSGGGFVIVWASDAAFTPGSDREVKGQLYNSSGARVGGEFLINTVYSSAQFEPSVAALSGGGFAVSWTDGSRLGGDASSNAVKGQIFNGVGAKVGPEFLVNTATANNQSDSDIAGLPGGGFVVTWTDTSLTGGDTSSSSIKGQLYDAAGAKVGTEFLVNTITLGGQVGSSVATTGSDFVVVWTGAGMIRGQRFAADGVKIGTEFVVAPGSQASVAALPGGGFAISWVATSPIDSDGGVRLQFFDALNHRVGDAFTANDTVLQSQRSPHIAVLSSGEVALAWTDASRHVFSTDVKTRILIPHQQQINGTQNGDTLDGTAGPDFIYGLLGNDTLFGLDGDDTLFGDSGNDMLSGGAGADTMDGGTGDDLMTGGVGNDIYIVDSILDVVTEAAGEGIDEIRTSVRKPALAANVENLTYTGSGNFSARGNSLDNVITGGVGSDIIVGKDGNDTLIGGSGDDILDGGAGTDSVNGGDGDDLIYVADGSDTVDGGTGRDTIIFYLTDTVFAAASSSNVEVFENLSGGNLTAGLNASGNMFGGSIGIDTIDGAAGDDVLYGRSGNDMLGGGNGSDRLFGMEDDDVLNGGSDNDYLYGDTGNDQLSGDSGDDVLYGDDGTDTLTGGAGRDMLHGGSGADLFVFASGDSGNSMGTADRIADLDQAQGDRIDLSAIDAIVGATDDAFTFIGTAAFGNVAGQLRYELIGGNTYVIGDTDGDGVADFMIRLDGALVLTGADFSL